MMDKPEGWREARAKAHLMESSALKLQMVEVCLDQIVAGADLIAQAFGGGGKLLLCGNGGSAADCQHMAAEFVNRLNADFGRPALPAIALTTDTSFLTSYANDVEFVGIFARQLEAHGQARDVLLGISTSGNSVNIIQAIKTAQAIGMGTIALTGAGGRLPEMASVAITVPSQHTQFIQEAHLAIEHIICDLVEQTLYA
jgi:phosphoheptose isomerase